MPGVTSASRNQDRCEKKPRLAVIQAAKRLNRATRLSRTLLGHLEMSEITREAIEMSAPR
jgi:hypothetical protein